MKIDIYLKRGEILTTPKTKPLFIHPFDNGNRDDLHYALVQSAAYLNERNSSI